LLESRLIFDFEIPEIVLKKLSGKCGIPLDTGEFGRYLAAVAEGHFKKGDGAADWIKENAERLEAFGEAGVLGGETKVHATTIVLERNDLESALELIERERITNAGGVPTIAWQIIEHPRFHEFDLSSLESISYGGAPSAPELVRRMKERFPNLKPGQGWGMTETSATATSNSATTATATSNDKIAN
jgi:hypothetical protein